jgi:stage V sporulation protein K
MVHRRMAKFTMFLEGSTNPVLSFTCTDVTIANRNGLLYFESSGTSGKKHIYLDIGSLSECEEINGESVKLATRGGRTVNIEFSSDTEADRIIELIDQNLADQESTQLIRPNGEADILFQVNQLIGLDKVKSEIQKVVNLSRYHKRVTKQGATVSPVSRHMIFTGNPGTGKTTVARMVSNIYKRLGILSRGHLVEADRASLVGGYLGQTAVKTNELIDSALGGILFIDEAYSLYPSETADQFGEEAINTLIKRMEDERDNLIVIAAGYQTEMKRFINSNPGLRSRFSKYIQFDDYSAEELSQIFYGLLKGSGHTVSTECKDRIEFIFEAMDAMKDEKFGNGRSVRNLYERVIENLASRLADSNSNQDLFQILPNDITIDDLNFIMGSNS